MSRSPAGSSSSAGVRRSCPRPAARRARPGHGRPRGARRRGVPCRHGAAGRSRADPRPRWSSPSVSPRSCSAARRRRRSRRSRRPWTPTGSSTATTPARCPRRASPPGAAPQAPRAAARPARARRRRRPGPGRPRLPRPRQGQRPARRRRAPRRAMAGRAGPRSARHLAALGMLWLYWRRLRMAVLAVVLGIGSLVVLAVIVGSLAGHQRAVRVLSARGTGAQLRRPAARTARFDPVAIAAGIGLMDAAATACQSVSYTGTQIVAWWGQDGSSTYLAQVWHRADEPEFTQGGSDAGPAPPGVLDVSARLVGLMRANYWIEYSGNGTASGRPARIVSIWRRDGTLAARYWLDRSSGLPLRRELFDRAGRLVNEGAYIDIRIGAVDGDGTLVPGAPAWGPVPQATTLAALRKRGWPLPPALAGDLALVTVTSTATRAGTVLDASYSDGLSVISVFVQRGELPQELPGWHRADVGGWAVYASGPGERSLTWSARGFVYTVIADAPQETVERAVDGLPHERGLGFWGRLTRGLRRIESWFNPFG